MFFKYTLQENSSNGDLTGDNLGACPTREHSITHPQCGFVGCVDLRPWAKANRYRFRLEESYRVENSTHVRGDGRWFVEILCKNGLIYPHGGINLLAYANRGVKRHIAAIGPDIQRHQTDGGAEVFKFPVERLDEVAAILRPRKRRAIGASPERMRAMRERQKLLVQVRQIDQERTEGVNPKGPAPLALLSRFLARKAN